MKILPDPDCPSSSSTRQIVVELLNVAISSPRTEQGSRRRYYQYPMAWSRGEMPEAWARGYGTHHGTGQMKLFNDRVEHKMEWRKQPEMSAQTKHCPSRYASEIRLCVHILNISIQSSTEGTKKITRSEQGGDGAQRHHICPRTTIASMFPNHKRINSEIQNPLQSPVPCTPGTFHRIFPVYHMSHNAPCATAAHSFVYVSYIEHPHSVYQLTSFGIDPVDIKLDRTAYYQNLTPAQTEIAVPSETLLTSGVRQDIRILMFGPRTLH